MGIMDKRMEATILGTYWDNGKGRVTETWRPAGSTRSSDSDLSAQSEEFNLRVWEVWEQAAVFHPNVAQAFVT